MLETRRLTTGHLFYIDPKLALDRVFEEGEARRFANVAFMWVSHLGTDLKTRYGRYRDVQKSELEGRTYQIEYLDYAISIFFTDVLFDSATRTYIKKEVTDGTR